MNSAFGGRDGIEIEPAHCGFGALGAPLAVLSAPLRLAWLAGLTLYGAAVALVSLSCALRTSVKLVWPILLTVPAIHLAWGSGSWFELAKRMLLRRG